MSTSSNVVEKVFWIDPYLTELRTRIATVEGAVVTLEKTIFYAFSGGQESDSGTIGPYSVMEARKEGHQIYYKILTDHTLSPGDEVIVKIDWARRHRLMRLHFAAEIVLELFYKAFPGIEKIGAHIAADKARIDFKWKENFSSQLAEIQNEANKIVVSDSPIVSAFDDTATERRYWEIPGFSKVPCGGTHLRRTSEIGAIWLKRDNIGSGKQRVMVFAEKNEKNR